jgi:hypothetical protein
MCKPQEIPLLLTTTSSDTPDCDSGKVGQNDTVELFGNEKINGTLSNGFGIGYNSDCLSASWFKKSGNTIFSQDSSPTEVLSVPFLDIKTGNEGLDVINISNPTAECSFTGDITISSDIGVSGCNGDKHIDLCDGGKVLIGVQKSDIVNDVILKANSIATLLSTNPPPGTEISRCDNFETMNTFAGGNIGFVKEYDYGPFIVTLIGKVGVGNVHQKVNISGSSQITIDNITLDSIGGIFAQPTNIGEHTRNKITVVPGLEIEIKHKCTGIKVGYFLKYWNKIALAGDQIDTTLNSSQFLGDNPLIGPARPEFIFKDGSFWIKGWKFAINNLVIY